MLHPPREMWENKPKGPLKSLSILLLSTNVFELWTLSKFPFGSGVCEIFKTVYSPKVVAHVLCVDTGRSSETAKAHRG
eukprot:TRINITY_DN7208_c0_g1_i1.p1 TRINITY_DN7208_c0_g1~~TRINITY_DN7208_c0_g1_i1.p1  ORF type:complete len:78 (+),score=20.72 TRINITY_DN7208_c0_g1_i1:256-489(+)